MVLTITNISSSISSIDHATHLKPPNLSGEYRLSLDLSKNVNEIAFRADSTNDINPCNGSYIKTNGTTCGLREIMIGRCNEYQYIKRGLYLSNTT